MALTSETAYAIVFTKPNCWAAGISCRIAWSWSNRGKTKGTEPMVDDVKGNAGEVIVGYSGRTEPRCLSIPHETRAMPSERFYDDPPMFAMNRLSAASLPQRRKAGESRSARLTLFPSSSVD